MSYIQVTYPVGSDADCPPTQYQVIIWMDSKLL